MVTILSSVIGVSVMKPLSKRSCSVRVEERRTMFPRATSLRLRSSASSLSSCLICAPVVWSWFLQ
jgi:hypothetical protein